MTHGFTTSKAHNLEDIVKRLDFIAWMGGQFCIGQETATNFLECGL